MAPAHLESESGNYALGAKAWMGLRPMPSHFKQILLQEAHRRSRTPQRIGGSTCFTQTVLRVSY